jgi:tetratricopeptide (TPR) repeat protein
MKVQNDYDNILSGWHHALDFPLLKEIGKYVFTISAWFQARGLYFEAQQTFAKALHLLDGEKLVENASTRMRLMTHYGWFLLACNKSDLAREILQNALEIATGLDNSYSADIGILLGFLSVTFFYVDPEKARGQAELGLSKSQFIGFQFGVWMCLTILGEIEHLQERYETAFHYHEQALLNAEQHRNTFSLTQSLAHMGCGCYALKRLHEELVYLRRSLSLMHEFVDVDSVFLVIFGIAGIYELCDKPEVALELLAILVHHPQYGSPVLGPTAETLKKRLRSKLPEQLINNVMGRAEQGNLSSRYLDPQFIISFELVDQLEALLEETTGMTLSYYSS